MYRFTNLFNTNNSTKFMLLTLALSFFIITPIQALQAQNNSLKRFPDIHEDKVVFVSGEDIWLAPATGGQAIRLTTNDGAEIYPKFSPDGNLIAFTGQYDGNSDVYVMDVYGGNITRLTWHPSSDAVIGWNQAKNKIIFRSNRKSANRYNRLFMISPDGSGLEEIPLHEISTASFSPDGKRLAYNRIYRESRTWKRYEGGTAQDVYLYDFATNSEENITNFKGTDRTPMWIGDKIYFNSDRDRVLNIYSYDLTSKSIDQITFHKDYDVRRASFGGQFIVYEIGGQIYKLDTATGRTLQIQIMVKSDAPELRPYLKAVEKNITDYQVSPSGKRALIVARGEIFTVPKEHGPTVNLTNSSGARDKDARWSPDGKWFAYISDKDGEYQVYVEDVRGNKGAIKLTNFKDGYRHSLRWSPDSKMLGFTDQKLKLYYINISDKEVVEVDQATYENIDVALDLKPIYDYSWSPDSKWLAYVKMNDQQVYQIWLYSLKNGKKQRVSSEQFNDSNPIFSADGQFLFFISNRRFSPTYGDFEWEMVYKKMAGIYSIKLNKKGSALFPYRSDDENVDKKKSKKGDVAVNVNFDGIADRVEAFPLERGNYRNLTANAKGVFYLNKDEGDFNRFEFRAVKDMDLYSFPFKERKEHSVIKKVSGYRLSADGSTIIYKADKKIGLIKSTAKESKGKPISMKNLKMQYDPKVEWTQIFNEAWRMERDFYYEPNMHGLDWDAMKVKYGKLLELATSRQDIRFIIGELIGELNTSHTYVFGGDSKRKAERLNIGLLGVDWKVDVKNNRYQFEKIYKTVDFNRNNFSPLVRPDIEINSGDYLLKVNGVDVKADRNIYSYFEDLGKKQVTIVVSSSPGMNGARTYVVKPVTSEYYLRYLDWVEGNRLKVDKASNGQIGYLHFPDTYNGSAVNFPRYFYSQARKKGLIIDGRFNGGGLDPLIFLRRLATEPLGYWTRRYSHDQMAPSYGVRAHMVCITNRQAGSGGDELPFEFKQLGLGPVIGTRTWGGLVGVSMWLSTIDGGGLSAPDYRIYSPEGEWVVENYGVDPDIVIDLQPLDAYNGKDAQLNKAVEMLLEKIKTEPREWPKHPAFPVDN